MWCVAPIVCQHNFLQMNFKGTNKILVFMTPSIFLPCFLCLKRQNEHDNSNDLALEWRKKNAEDTSLLWRKSLITSMYNFSKQGKHFNKLITISKQRSGWVKAKTFMLWTTVVELGMHDLWVKHIIQSLTSWSDKRILIRLFEKRVLNPSRIWKWEGRWYLKNCATKLKSCAANVVSEVVNFTL